MRSYSEYNQTTKVILRDGNWRTEVDQEFMNYMPCVETLALRGDPAGLEYFNRRCVNSITCTTVSQPTYASQFLPVHMLGQVGL